MVRIDLRVCVQDALALTNQKGEDWRTTVSNTTTCGSGGGLRRQMSGIKLPDHWQSDGTKPALHCVANGGEHVAVTAPLFQHIDGVEVVDVERNENANLWAKYSLDRDTVREQAAGDANERWLWHGTDALDDVLETGFNTAYASLEFNAYGVGNDQALWYHVERLCCR